MTYTTQVADVDTLRRIVGQFAASQNRPGTSAPEAEFGQPALMAGVPESPPGTTLVLPTVSASVADVPGGSRLELRPLTATFRRLLRADLREDRLPAGVVERGHHWEDGRAVGLEVTESDWPIRYMRWVTRVEARGERSLITQKLDYALKFGPLGWLLDVLVMKRKLTATLDAVFARLAKRAESPTPSAAGRQSVG